MNTAVTVRVDRSRDFDKALAALTQSVVYVGIPADNTNRTDDAPIGNAAIGYIQETGSPINNIPARPFLVPGIKSVADRLASIFRKAGQNALAGDLDAVQKGLNAAGIVAQSAVKARITAGIPPALAKSTLAARASRGVNRTKPLIDTGQLLNSITYVIRKK